jgi:hypothetical protein
MKCSKLRRLMCAVVTVIFGLLRLSEVVVVICSYVLLSGQQIGSSIQTPSVVTPCTWQYTRICTSQNRLRDAGVSVSSRELFIWWRNPYYETPRIVSSSPQPIIISYPEQVHAFRSYFCTFMDVSNWQISDNGSSLYYSLFGVIQNLFYYAHCQRFNYLLFSLCL